MNEEQIASNLKQSIQIAEEFSAPEPRDKPVDTNTGQATISPDYPLDEMVQYKLHDYFGQTYRPHDEVSKQQVAYIYQDVAKMINNNEYGFVIAKIRDLEQIIGSFNSETRIYKLYQWLKLNNIRKNIDMEMGALIHG